MKATIGRIVHYVSYGTPGGEYASQCRAAIVTEVGPGLLPDATNVTREHDSDNEVIGLAVLNPSGVFFNRAEYHDGAGQPGDGNCTLHENGPHRYCACGWTEDSYRGGTWHWPERSES